MFRPTGLFSLLAPGFGWHFSCLLSPPLRRNELNKQISDFQQHGFLAEPAAPSGDHRFKSGNLRLLQNDRYLQQLFHPLLSTPHPVSPSDFALNSPPVEG